MVQQHTARATTRYWLDGAHAQRGLRVNPPPHRVCPAVQQFVTDPREPPQTSHDCVATEMEETTLVAKGDDQPGPDEDST